MSGAVSVRTGVAGSGGTTTYQYDAVGRRTQLTDAAGTTTYRYDDLGRVMEVSSPLGTIGYDYDLDGSRILLEYPGDDPVMYSYSPGGRLETVTDWAGRTSSYAYTPSGLVDTLAQHGGLAAVYTYDRAQRLTSLQYAQDIGGLPVSVLRQDFTLDAEGNRTQLVEAGALGDPPAGASDTFLYEYDGLSRLTSADATLFGGGTRSETFSYDPATNIQARTGPAATYTMDGANRVTSDGAQAFIWDGADRLVQRGADTFTYDALSRLTSATVAGDTSTYSYDGDGLLATRTNAGDSTTFVWDTSVAPAPLLEAGTDRVVHGLGPLYLARADGSTIRLVRDALGSVRAELNDLGVVSKAFRYAAYGAITERTPLDATPTLLGFTGELTTPSGLLYLRARWYDAGTGRFMSRDPFNGTVEHPASQNLYAYAHANPARFTDPTGNCPFCLVMAVGGIAGATVNASFYLLASKQSGDFTWGGLAGAAATGAVIGAIAPVAGPAGGSFGGALATATLNALAGAGGYTVGLYAANAVDSVTGRPGTRTFSAEAALLHAAGSVVGGALGDKVSPMVGVHTLRQLRLFAPRTWAGLMRSGPNMQALEGSALVGALYSSGIGLLAHQGNHK